MNRKRSKLQRVLYPVFLVSCAIASALGLVMIWGVDSSILVGRLLGTSIVVAVAAAYTMSATQLVSGPAPEDDDG